MASNILGINPTSNKFYDVALTNLHKTFTEHDPDSIEIQFKFAQLRSIVTPYQQQLFRNLPQKVIADLQMESTLFTDNFLKSLSNQNVLYLNPLGHRTYTVAAGFNQKVLKKFYHIKDMLIKVSEFNRKHSYQQSRISNSPYHIYKQLSLNNNNHLLQTKDDNQLRMDLYIKENAPQQIQGRYSYIPNQGWIKTKKEPQCHQLDYLLAQRYYRMAITKEIVEQVNLKVLIQLAQYCKSVRNPFDIRLKKALRINKGKLYQISMSEILSITDLRLCHQIGSMFFQTNFLDTYVKKLFIGFYSHYDSNNSNLSWEIQLELSKQSNRTLKNKLEARRYGQARGLVQNCMEELHSIFFADHAIKTKEIPWLNHQLPPNTPEPGRLDNQFGTYMREHLYHKMETKQYRN